MTAAPATLARAEWVGAEDSPLHIAVVAPAGDCAGAATVDRLVEGLVERGHRVTLIGAATQGGKAHRFLPTGAAELRHVPGGPGAELLHAARAGQLLEGVDADIVHDHTVAGPLLARGRLVPTVVTVHGPVGAAGAYYGALAETVALVASSDEQRAGAPDLPWFATVAEATSAAAELAAAYESVYRRVLGSIRELDIAAPAAWPDDLPWWDGGDPLQEAS